MQKFWFKAEPSSSFDLPYTELRRVDSNPVMGKGPPSSRCQLKFDDREKIDTCKTKTDCCDDEACSEQTCVGLVRGE
jgi:hypothetical protein